MGESNHKDDFVLGVRVPVTSLCPCSKEISDYGAHNQRGYITIEVRNAPPGEGGENIVWIEELIEVAEKTFELLSGLNYCSPLGSALLGIRSVAKTADGNRLGIRSIRRLEEAGIRSFADLARLQTDDLVRLGIRPAAAQQIRDYVWRRSQ